MITNQEAFDGALKHLRAQGKRAVDENDSCMYRQGNLKCAIGALIPDEKYNPEFEHLSVCVESVIEAFDGNLEECDFYQILQEELHDDLDDDLTGLEQSAQNLAQKWKLNYVPSNY